MSRAALAKAEKELAAAFEDARAQAAALPRGSEERHFLVVVTKALEDFVAHQSPAFGQPHCAIGIFQQAPAQRIGSSPFALKSFEVTLTGLSPSRARQSIDTCAEVMLPMTLTEFTWLTRPSLISRLGSLRDASRLVAPPKV